MSCSGKKEPSGKKERRGKDIRVYSVTILYSLWFKALEGLTSRLERRILLCVSVCDGVWLGAWSHCGTAVVFFQFLSDHTMWVRSGIQQRLGMRPCMWEVLSLTAGAFAVSLFVFCGYGFRLWLSIHDVLSVPDFVPGQTEELIHIFVLQKKDCKTL